MNTRRARAAITPAERAVLDAIAATAQGNGRLHDVAAIAQRVGRTEEAVNRAVRLLHAKGALPRAGISEEAIRDARAQLARAMGDRTTPLGLRTFRMLIERDDLSDVEKTAARLLFRHATATARDPDRSVRRVRCDCGCRQIVLVRDEHLEHHFVNREHFRRWKRAREYPDDAPPGSYKREVLDALRAVIAERGATTVERTGGFPRNTINKYARGDWTYLAPTTVEYLWRVISDVVDPADPRLRELLDTPDIRAGMGTRGAAALARWRTDHPVLYKRAKGALRERKLGTSNPGVAKAKRAEWDPANPDRATKEEAFLATARRHAHLPTEQIRRAWKAMVGRCIRLGRAATDENARQCAGRQAADLGLTREIVLDYINRERGVLDRPGPLPDIDLLCAVRDIQEEHPQAGWVDWATRVNIRLREAHARLGREWSEMDPDTMARGWRENKQYLAALPRAKPAKGGLAWSPHDDAYLRAHPNLPDSALARHLGRNPKAVRLRRRALGLWKRTSALWPRPIPHVERQD